jgi:hypothetical protein
VGDAVEIVSGPNEAEFFRESNEKHRGACQRFYDITTFKKDEFENAGIIPLCILRRLSDSNRQLI